MEPKAYSYIRFSTKEQATGDSERRQSDPAQEIADNVLHLPLDDTLYLKDKGLSGYTGDNLTKGALGEFLRLVDEGQITAGSVLIMEDLDRLTRLPVLEAENLLTGILMRGIGIYTFRNNKLLTKETYNISDSILKSINLDQGNKEVAKKNDLIRKAWGNKRVDAVQGKKKMSRNCPMWLEPDGYQVSTNKYVTTGYKPIKERVAVIKLIFEMKLAGKGAEKIARELNQIKGIWKPEGKIINKETKERKQASWNTSTVELYLNNNRKLLGELQLYRYEKINGKRVNTPDGEPIKDYYPVVIDVELFNRVQELMRANFKKDGRGGGRSDKVNNLFPHLAVCAYCGSPMRHISKGDEKLHGKALFQCGNAIKGICKSTHLLYADVEREVLSYCKGLEVSDILPNSAKAASELSILNNQLQAIDGELELINEDIEGNMASKRIGKSDAYLKALEHAFDALNLKSEKLQKERKEIEDKILQLSNNSSQTEEQINNIRELIDLMKTLEGQERVTLRLNLRTQLKRLIKYIEVNTENKQVNIYFATGLRRMVLARTEGVYAIRYRDFKPKP
jgi:DNA invertase Pin-like site-specific DNA recombinase